jgi:hypothetical protein
VLLLDEAELSVAVFVCHLLHQVKGEGANLFDCVDSNLVLETSFTSSLDQVVVNLTSAEQYLLHG